MFPRFWLTDLRSGRLPNDNSQMFPALNASWMDETMTCLGEWWLVTAHAHDA